MSPHPSKQCGPCALCCKIMAVPEIEKPAHQWCQHCKIGIGCAIYEARPTACRECVWLQVPADVLDDQYRPDRLRVVLQRTNDGTGLVACCDPHRPMAWRHPLVLRLLRRHSAEGRATARAADRYWVVTTKTDWEVPPELLIRGPHGQVDARIPHEVARQIGLPERAK